MISRVIWVLGGSVNRPRGAGLVSGSERWGPDPEGFVLYLRWRWLFCLVLLCFQVTLLPAQEGSWAGAGVLAERWAALRGGAGGLGSPGTVPPPPEGQPAGAAVEGKVWGGEVVCLLQPVVEVSLCQRWLSAVDNGYHFLIVCKAWRLLRGTDG